MFVSIGIAPTEAVLLIQPDIFYNDELILKLKVRSLDLVSAVKKRIGVKTRLSPDEISLEFNGKPLSDNLKLDHCGVSEDSPRLTLTVNTHSCDEVVMEQTPYQSPYEAVGDSRNDLVQQSPQGASLGGQDKGADSSIYYHQKSYNKVEIPHIDLRTHYPTPGASSDVCYAFPCPPSQCLATDDSQDPEEIESTGDIIPERLANSISLGLR